MNNKFNLIFIGFFVFLIFGGIIYVNGGLKVLSSNTHTTLNKNSEKTLGYVVYSKNGKIYSASYTSYQDIKDLNKPILVKTESNAKRIVKSNIGSSDEIAYSNSFTPETARALVNNGYKLNDYNDITSKINSISRNINNLNNDIKKKSCDSDCKKENEKEIKENEKKLKELTDIVDINDGWNDVLGEIDGDSTQEFLEQYNNKKCGNTFVIGYLCKHFTSTTKEEIKNENYLDQLNNIDERKIKLSEEDIRIYGSLGCSSEDSVYTCNQKITQYNDNFEQLNENIKKLNEKYNNLDFDEQNSYEGKKINEEIKKLEESKNNIEKKIKLNGQQIKEYKDLCSSEDSIYSCNQKIKDENKKIELNKIKIDFDMDYRNKARANIFFKNNGIDSNNNNNIYTACKDNLDSKNCKDAISNYNGDKKDQIQKDFEIARGLTEKEDTTAYIIAKGLFQPSENALQAARLFGFEADYSNVPDILRKSFPSQICEAKIDGYLDKKLDIGGGSTQYGSCSEVLDPKNPNIDRNKCSQVIGDIRAQRTKITPDLKTIISYSAFIRAPNSNIKVITAISYKLKNGDLKKKLLNNETMKLNSNQIKNIYQNTEVLINKTSNEVDENSFKIYLFAIYSDKSIYLNLMSPIYLMTFDDRNNPTYQDDLLGSGNALGNNQSNTLESSSQDLTSNDILNMIN